MEVTGLHVQNGRLLAWVDLPGGISTAFQFCVEHDAYPGVKAAYDGLASAVVDRVTLAMMEALPEAPSSPPLLQACRICDTRSKDNTTDPTGRTFCPEHRTLGAP